MEPDARVGAGLRVSPPRRRGSTCSAPAAPAWRRRISIGNKIALGQIDSAIAAGVDTVSDPPIVYPEAVSAAVAEELPRQERGRAASLRGSVCAGNISAGAAGLGRAAHRSVDGRAAPSSWSRPGASRRLEQDQLALESHQKASAAYASRLLPGPGARISRTQPGQQHPHRHDARQAVEAAPGVRYVGCRNLDGGKFDAHDRRRRGRAARLRGMGARAQSAGPRLPSLRQGCGGRLRRKEGGAAHGARLRGAADARAMRN